MCIIAAKPAGTKMPAQTTIENMWYRNHDGAGFMYAQDGVVHIEKGYMKLDDFNKALERVRKTVDLDSVAVVMHFRIATHGGVIPANTHPFPVTSSVGMLQKLRCNTTLGVAHNGIIHSVSPRKGISDTMEYIATQLAPLYKGVPEFYKNSHLMELVKNGIDSKLAILTHMGELYTIGSFEESEGIMYSNTSYKPYTSTVYSYNGSKWSILGSHYGEFDYYQPSYEFTGHRIVQWLFDDDVYVLNAAGSRIDMDNMMHDFVVDTDGKVYDYSYLCDGLVYQAGYRAYSSTTGKQLFADADHELASMEETYEESYGDDCPWDTDPAPLKTLPFKKSKTKKAKKS